jgi:hypothetical protein
MRSGSGAGVAKFIVLVQHRGRVPADWVDRPGAGSGRVCLPSENDGSRSNPLLGHNMTSSTDYEPDIDTFRRTSTRVVIAAGRRV